MAAVAPGEEGAEGAGEAGLTGGCCSGVAEAECAGEPGEGDEDDALAPFNVPLPLEMGGCTNQETCSAVSHGVK